MNLTGRPSARRHRPAIVLVCLWAVLTVLPRSAKAQTAANAESLTVFVSFAGAPAAAVTVTLRRVDVSGGAAAPPSATLATDAGGTCRFASPPAGVYEVRAERGDLSALSAIALAPGSTERLSLVLVRGEDVTVAGTLQPEAPGAATTLPGVLTERLPIQDDLSALLPLVPGVVRGIDGRIQLKGGPATQGGFQIGGATAADPSTGELAIALPTAAVESVTVLANPYAAEYGRFTSAVSEVRTRQGGASWRFTPNSFVPRFRLRQNGVWAPTLTSFTPRLAVDGPLVPQKLFLASTVHVRFVKTRRQDLPGEPMIDVEGVDAYTRLDTATLGRHRMTLAHAAYPRTIERANLDTFNPPEVTYTFDRGGLALAFSDNVIVGSSAILETMVSLSRYDADITGEGNAPMTMAPSGRRGTYFNDQIRNTRTIQSLTTLGFSRGGMGEHLFKVGLDVLATVYRGQSVSRPVEVVRADGTLDRRITFDGFSRQDLSATDVAVFVQDRWHVTARTTLDAGLRIDRDGVTTRTVVSPRVGAAVAIGTAGNATIRGGVGVFHARTPLNVGAFTSYERRTETPFAADGVTPAGPAITYDHRAGRLTPPRAIVWNAEIIRRLGDAVTLKLGHLRRYGSRDPILQPIASADGGELRLASTGRSKYWEQELTVRFMPAPRFDLSASWVASDARGDLNTFDMWFGNERAPVLQANAYGPRDIDVPHRLILRGTVGLPGQWDLVPLLEVRHGFPYSQVDETQTIVGLRNEGGRFPTVALLDVAVHRPFRIGPWRVRAGVRVYNLLNRFTPRDVQNNVDATDFGAFFNRIQRSFSLTFWIDR
jgi:hypothetical protein